MEITITNGEQTTVIVDGRLDTVNSPGFEKEIAPVLSGDMQCVAIDCSGLSYISSSGLRLFLMLQKTANAKGGKLTLKGMRPEIREIFDMTGFTALFVFEP